MAESACPPITVEGDWSSAQNRTVATKLQVYFGSKRRSGGGECRVQADSGAPRAAVFFNSAEGEEPPPRHFESVTLTTGPFGGFGEVLGIGQVRRVFRTTECRNERTRFTASPETVLNQKSAQRQSL